MEEIGLVIPTACDQEVIQGESVIGSILVHLSLTSGSDQGLGQKNNLQCSRYNRLTHCGLKTPYGYKDLG